MVAQRRQAEGVVVLRVLVVADADERHLHEFDHRGEDLLARQAGELEVPGALAAYVRPALGRVDPPPLLRAVAPLAPLLVVAVVVPPAVVAPGGRGAAAVAGGGAGVGVRRRDGRYAGAVEGLSVLDAL